VSHNQVSIAKRMREILISATVCVACLLVALVSQLVNPTMVSAAPVSSPAAVTNPVAVSSSAADSRVVQKPAQTRAAFELDPDEPNPTLFVMASDQNNTVAQASALGGEILAAKERTTESGLRITDLRLGDGPEAKAGQTVIVNYRGTLESGKEFDSSYGRGPFSFPLGAGRVIKGWDEGVAGMQVGGKRKLVIPPDLGYGQRGAGGVIPPNATLIFEVELLEIRG
jgi:FKBP-type peptidyl-prolyl cis-trans isomerase